MHWHQLHESLVPCSSPTDKKVHWMLIAGPTADFVMHVLLVVHKYCMSSESYGQSRWAKFRKQPFTSKN